MRKSTSYEYIFFPQRLTLYVVQNELEKGVCEAK